MPNSNILQQSQRISNYNVYFQQKGCIFKQHQWSSCVTYLELTIIDNIYLLVFVQSHILVSSDRSMVIFSLFSQNYVTFLQCSQ